MKNIVNREDSRIVLIHEGRDFIPGKDWKETMFEED